MSSFMRCALLAPLIMMASVSYGDKLNAETQVNIVEAESSTVIGGIDVASRPLPSGETKPAIHNKNECGSTQVNMTKLKDATVIGGILQENTNKNCQ